MTPVTKLLAWSIWSSLVGPLDDGTLVMVRGDPWAGMPQSKFSFKNSSDQQWSDSLGTIWPAICSWRKKNWKICFMKIQPPTSSPDPRTSASWGQRAGGECDQRRQVISKDRARETQCEKLNRNERGMGRANYLGITTENKRKKGERFNICCGS